MQKKIVAAICAAALALALPVTAFATYMTTVPSQGTASLAEEKSGNVTLSDIEVTGGSDIAVISVKGNGEVAAPASNVIPGSAASFTITAQNKKENAIKGLGRKSVLTAKVSFADSIVNNINFTVSDQNLYMGYKFDSNLQGVTVTPQAKQIELDAAPAPSAGYATAAATDASTIELTNLGTGTLTVWMQNGPFLSNDASNAAKVADEAKDGSKSPKTGALL